MLNDFLSYLLALVCGSLVMMALVCGVGAVYLAVDALEGRLQKAGAR
jgi:hypothetical protein